MAGLSCWPAARRGVCRRFTIGGCFRTERSFTGSFKVTIASARRCPADVREPANFDPSGESRPGFPGRGVIASLKHLAEALRIALTPTASDRCVVVHKNVWTVRDRLTLELGVDENKKFAILVARRVEIFLVTAAELPIVEERVGVTVCSAIWIEPARQDCCDRVGVCPKFNVEKIRRVIPRRWRIESRFAFGRERIVEAFKHDCSPVADWIAAQTFACRRICRNVRNR